MTLAAPTTQAVDKSYFKSPTESVDQYNTRIATYNDSKAKVEAQNAATTAAANPPQTTLAQDQAKTANQGKPGFDVFGNPVAAPATTGTTPAPPSGMSTADYNAFKSANPTLEPTDQDMQRSMLADERAQRAQADADYQAQAKQVSDTITNIQNGTTPLTAGEQAQVDGLKRQFQVLIDQQTVQNAGATGTANIRGYQTGAAEYDPNFQVKTIGAVVSAGQQKISDLNIKMASAVASLTQSFHDNDIRAVQNAWSIYQDAAKEHADALQKTIDDTQSAIKDAQAQAKAAQDEADKQQQYQLDVAKFNQTGDQNAFDNAFKVEQEKIAQQNAQATQAQAAAVSAETARHNRATEAVAAFNAGMGAGGGGNNTRITQSAELGPTGNPDPVSQKQVLDQITQQYGPMTATAIKGLSDYSMNPADWSTRAAKGGMTREQAVVLAKMVDPTYDDRLYPIRATYMKNLASNNTGSLGAAINSANKAINHLTAFATTVAQLPNGPIESVNAMDNYLTLNQAVKQNYSKAGTEGNGVADELAKFFKGSGTTDVASIDSWKSKVSPNASPASQAGLVSGAIELLSGQLQTLSEQYQATMGKAPTQNFLGPSAMASLSKLKNQGYEINIPGVNYTDVNAYLKNGGTQEALTKAHQTLVDANDPNNPPTPENALELAQLQ